MSAGQATVVVAVDTVDRDAQGAGDEVDVVGRDVAAAQQEVELAAPLGEAGSVEAGGNLVADREDPYLLPVSCRRQGAVVRHGPLWGGAHCQSLLAGSIPCRLSITLQFLARCSDYRLGLVDATHARRFKRQAASSSPRVSPSRTLTRSIHEP